MKRPASRQTQWSIRSNRFERSNRKDSIPSVMAVDTLEGVVDITEGPTFARGVKYEVANGVQIPKLGGRTFVGIIVT